MTDAGRDGRRRRPPRHRWRVLSAVIAVGLVALVVGVAMHRAGQPQSAALASGALAPDGSFTTTSGQTTTVRAMRGQPTLIWFVSTSCGSCEAGTQAMAAQIDQFARHHVKVVELELFDNLGAGSSDIAAFGRSLAGPKFTDPDWVWGNASQAMTTTFDPNAYLDVYYLLDQRPRPAGAGL